jgi:hypothetical protein
MTSAARYVAVLAAAAGGVLCVVLVASSGKASAQGSHTDGRIVFASTRDGGDFDIFSMGPDGTGVLQLTQNSAEDRNPQWSPDSTKIVFQTTRDGDTEVYVMKPDGSQIAFTSNRDANDEIYKMSAGGAGQTNLTNTSFADDDAPTWSPDGSQIAFHSFAAGNDDIFKMNAADGTGQTDVSLAAAGDDDPDWSPGGGLIAFSADVADTFDIWTIDPNGGARTQLTFTEDNFTPVWSPSGDRMAFMSFRDGDTEIFTMAADGSGVVNVTNEHPAADRDPDWGSLLEASPSASPVTTIDSVAVGATDAVFTFSSSTQGVTFRCQLDGGTVETCTSPETYSGLAPGSHTFQVFAVDSFGHFEATPQSTTFAVTGSSEAGATDPDGDAILTGRDNCPDIPNPSQIDIDRDGIGDLCDDSNGSLTPTLAQTVVVRVVSGRVFIRYPRGKRQTPFTGAIAAGRIAQAQPGAQSGFVPLNGASTVPLGSTIDTEEGRIALTSAANRAGATQTADFYDGVFTVTQADAGRPVTELRLRGLPYRANCAVGASRAAHAAAKRRLGKLWGSGTGRFRTRGRFSAATVRGTKWLAVERCDGTLTQVTRGTVSVFVRTTGQRVSVSAGDSFLAPAKPSALRKLGLR